MTQLGKLREKLLINNVLISPGSLVVTTCAGKCSVQTFYILLIFTVFYDSENRQRLFPKTALNDWFFITETQFVYCAVRTESLNRDWATKKLPALCFARFLVIFSLALVLILRRCV